MTKGRSIAGCFAAATMVFAAGIALGQDTADDVESWLDRMNAAVEQMNYRGTYVHNVDGKLEKLHIVHRFADGVVTERINAAGSNGREILLTEDSVRSVFPEKQLVVLEKPEGFSIPYSASLNYTDELERYYQMTTTQGGVIAERETQVVSIRARDEYRYGYLLWLDRETALPLKMQVRNEEGTVIESILFTDIEVFDSIPEFAVAALIESTGFSIRRQIPTEFESAGTEVWAAMRLPSGFLLSLSQRTLLAGSKYPVQHLVYTDGLATVSVMIAHPKSDADMDDGFRRFGSTNMYSLKIDGRLTTAVGQVPRRTVQMIATSLDAR